MQETMADYETTLNKFRGLVAQLQVASLFCTFVFFSFIAFAMELLENLLGGGGDHNLSSFENGFNLFCVKTYFLLLLTTRIYAFLSVGVKQMEIGSIYECLNVLEEVFISFCVFVSVFACFVFVVLLCMCVLIAWVKCCSGFIQKPLFWNC